MVKRTFANEDMKSSLSGSSCTSADLSRREGGIDAGYKEFSPRISKQLKNCHKNGRSKSNYQFECGYVGDLRDGDEVKSAELESNGSKVTADDEDFMHLDSKESVVTSVGDRKLCSEGFAESEAVGLGHDNKPSSCRKRILIEIDEDDSMKEWKKKRTISEVMSKDENRGLVVESGGNTCNGENDVILVDPEVPKEEESSSVMNGGTLCGMVRWLSLIARDPWDPTVGLLPEKTKWKNYGNENMWKRVFLAREALLLKRHDTSGKQPVFQNNQRMHPSMYEDSRSGYKLRERLQCKQGLTAGNATHHPQSCSESFSSESRNNPSNLSTADSLFNDHEEDETPLGPEFQAFVPEWTGVASESDSKWLGTQTWPLRRSQGSLSLIERDPIGRGRQDSCGCQFRGSSKCVRFHIDEKRKRLKLELGAAFNLFEFDKMGEDVEVSWTIEEQNKFADIVRSNPLSQEKSFWVEMVKHFPIRKREELVSYYVNVFLLRRRAFQNRISPSNIDSDDDESESQVPVANSNSNVKPSNSIFYSPTKPHTKHK